MLIPRRTVRTSQPQQAAGIDWSNPITKGLRIAISGADPLLNVVSGVLGTQVLSPYGTVDRKGRGTKSPAQSYYKFPAQSLAQYTPEVTLFNYTSVTDDTMRPDAILLGLVSDIDGGMYGKVALGQHYSTGCVQAIDGQRYAYETERQELVRNALGETHSYCAVFSGGSGSLYKNGIFQASAAVGSAPLQNVNTCTIGASPVHANGGWLNPIYVSLVFYRALSAKEVKSLSANPWQIFEDEEDYLFIPEAGGGGSVSLIVADALHGHAVDSPSFSMATYLAVAESLHTQAADNLTLSTTGSANLAIQEAAHAHVSDGVALTTRWLLIVADALHTHAADNLTMGVTGATTLTVADATSVHTADSVALSVIAFLAIADAVSQHAADNLTLDTSNATFLTVQEATHSHGTDGIALTLDTWLAIVDAAHAHTADAPTLSLGQLSLQIADALHAMYSDIVFLTLPGGNLTTDQKFIIRATARRLAAIGLARNNIINRRAS